MTAVMESSIRECLEAMVSHAKSGMIPGPRVVTECERTLKRKHKAREKYQEEASTCADGAGTRRDARAE